MRTCESPALNPEDQYTQLVKALERYVDLARAELMARWDSWQKDLFVSEQYEVAGGLMARQVSLAAQMAGAPTIWTGHVAPILLRTMTDTYITFAWILESLAERSKAFILHGIGQEKLILEHHRARVAGEGRDPEGDPIVEAHAQWVNSQRAEFLTEVNVGSWSGLDVRRMAEEADCLDLYRYAYTPFSSATHSMWPHLLRYNLASCTRPLHKHHRIPIDPELQPDADYMYRAARYVSKTFRKFDKSTGVTVQAESALNRLVADLRKLAVEESPPTPDLPDSEKVD